MSRVGSRESARTTKAPGRRRDSRPGVLRRFGRVGLAIAKRRPGHALVLSAVALLGVSVGWNALVLQPGRHPAPLFGPKMDAAPAPGARRAEAPVPPPAPRPVAAPALATSPEPPGRPAAGSSPATPSTAADPIGALIRTGSLPESDGRTDPRRATVTMAQKALTRLGYGPLKADGVMGSGTRQAVERFERDRKLPVTGTLASQTAQLLSSEAGIRPD